MRAEAASQPTRGAAWLSVLMALLVLFTLPGPAGAGVGALTDEGAAPEWWQTLPPAQPGFPVALGGAYLAVGSSPTLVDLDGDGRLEVLVAGGDREGGTPGTGGFVYAYRHDGTLCWQTQVRAPVNSTPTAVDLTNDGYPDVVVSLGGFPEMGPWDGGVIALDGLTGQELWTFDTQDWCGHNPDGWRDGVFSTPAAGDVDGDGQPEIAFGAWDQCVYLLDHDGQPLWGNIPGRVPGVFCGGHGYYNEDTLWSSPALADLTGDGRLEIIIGADISPGNSWGDPAGGYLYVFDADGSTLAQEWLDQMVASSPAVADLDNDGENEVVVGTGDYWPDAGHYVSAFDFDPAPATPTDRLVLRWQAPTAGQVFASPAISDLDQDGWLDVVITVPVSGDPNGSSLVYAWRGKNGQALFQRATCDYLGHSSKASSPIIADLDDDLFPEILFSHAWEVAVLNHDGTYYSDYSSPRCGWCIPDPDCARDHEPTTELTYWAQWSLHATPAVGDLDGNGLLEVVIGGHNPMDEEGGMLFAWTGHDSQGGTTFWPTWRHDESHSGNERRDLVPPTNPTLLLSTSHTPGVWSTTDAVNVSWSGAADEGSGLGGYSIEWDASPGTLPDTVLDLGANAGDTTSPPLPPGDSWYFHIRTADKAGNWAPSARHLGPFLVALHLVQGRILGARGAPVAGAQVVADPPVMNQALSTSGGDYLLAFATTGLFDLTASHSSFESLPPMFGVAVDGDLDGIDFYLPPLPNLIANSGFETGSNWEMGGIVPPAPIPGMGHTGNYALSMGTWLAGNAPTQGPGADSAPPPPERSDTVSRSSPPAWPQEPGSAPGTWSASQAVSLPSDLPRTTLSWMYRVEGEPEPGDQLVVSVQGPDHTETHPVSLDAAAWTHDWMDIESMCGPGIEGVVRFELVRPSATEPLTVLIDEVSLGPVPYHRILLPVVLASH